MSEVHVRIANLLGVTGPDEIRRIRVMLAAGVKWSMAEWWDYFTGPTSRPNPWR